MNCRFCVTVRRAIGPAVYEVLSCVSPSGSTTFPWGMVILPRYAGLLVYQCRMITRGIWPKIEAQSLHFTCCLAKVYVASRCYSFITLYRCTRIGNMIQQSTVVPGSKFAYLREVVSIIVVGTNISIEIYLQVQERYRRIDGIILSKALEVHR